MLSSEWCAWIAESLVGGTPPAKIVARLVEGEVSRSLAERAVDEIASSPALHGVAHALAKVRAAEQRARLFRELAQMTPSRGSIVRRPKPTADEFFERYWANNQPVIFTDAMKGWRPWTPQDMKKHVGDLAIEVTDGRDGDPLYDQNSAKHSKPTTIAELVDRILRAPREPTNDFYMVAQNKALDRPKLRAFVEKRIVIDEALFDPKLFAGGTSLWLGPKGTVTPLHHDGTNIFFNQIHGRKKFILISPHHERLLDAAQGYYAMFDPEDPPSELTWWNEVFVHEIILYPTETLFLPVGWWHHVRALDASISLSLLNFRRPNDFAFYRPGFARP